MPDVCIIISERMVCLCVLCACVCTVTDRPSHRESSAKPLSLHFPSGIARGLRTERRITTTRNRQKKNIKKRRKKNCWTESRKLGNRAFFTSCRCHLAPLPALLLSRELRAESWLLDFTHSDIIYSKRRSLWWWWWWICMSIHRRH